MCKIEVGSITFCSCAENLDLTKDGNDFQYVWILDRVVGKDKSGIIGLVLMPANELDNLRPDFIVQELNTKNLFDFEYQPQKNDQLRIEKHDDGNFDPCLKFHFDNQWHIGGLLPFTYQLEVYKKGKVRLVGKV